MAAPDEGVILPSVPEEARSGHRQALEELAQRVAQFTTLYSP